jgi:beta-N-acetylhexosaminidase
MDTSRKAARWIDATLGHLSLERRIGQMITAEIAGGYLADADPRLGRWIRLAKELGVGGFVIYGGTPRDVARLTNLLQGEAEVPILMSSDFEGGPGQQVAGASEFPGDMAFSAAGSEDLVYRAAGVGAVEGRAMGIHLTYSPVADVTVGAGNPAESVRTFGADVDLLGRMIRAYIRGYQEHGMLTTAKHFPGRGDSRKMPGHPGFAWIDRPAADIEAREMRAFRHAIEGGVSFIMTEHIAVPSVTGGSELPASVEPKLVTGWIRERLGFTGIITSDDLWYDAVVARFGAEDVAVKAVQAGHDVVLKPRDPFAAAARMVRAVKDGEIDEARIDASVRRILAAKARLGLHENRLVDESGVSAAVGSPAHLAVVRETADRSLTLLKNEGVLPVSTAALAGIVNVSVQKAGEDPSPSQLAAHLAAAFPGTRSFTLRPDTGDAVREAAAQAAAASSLAVISLFVPRDRGGDPSSLRDADLALIRRILRDRPGRSIVMSYGNPYHLRRVAEASAFALGYGERGWFGNQAAYFDSFIRLLKGELKPTGRLPVPVDEAYPLGAGL